MATAGWFLAFAAALIAAVVVALSCRAAVAAGRASYMGSSSSSSLDSGTVTSLLADCGDFVRHGAAASLLPAPGTPCCGGVVQLYAVAADSPENWRSVCGCMAGLVRQYSSNASAIALLPVLCGVLPTGFKVDTLTYCRSPPFDVWSHG